MGGCVEWCNMGGCVEWCNMGGCVWSGEDGRVCGVV